MCAKLRVVEIDNLSDLLALEEKWNDILSRCDHNFFSTWEWLSTWWRHFGDDKRLLVLLAEDNGITIGIAPLMYSVHTMFGLRRGRIEFVGTPSSDYADFILADKPSECINLFVDHLSSLPEKWDCVDLMDIPENAKCLPFLTEASKKTIMIHRCPYIQLPESYELFLKGLSGNQRRNIHRALRRLEETFTVEFVDYSKLQSYSEGIHFLFELHQKQWESKGFPGIFADQQSRDFTLDIAKSLFRRKWLCLFLLRVSGEPIAVAYGFKYRFKFYGYVTGLDPKYKKYDVGNSLRAHMISELIKEGLTEFDFMRGAEEYKDRWSSRARWNYQVVITRKGAIANAQHLLYNAYWRLGNRLKHSLKINR